MEADLLIRVAAQLTFAAFIATIVTKATDTVRNIVEPPPLAGGTARRPRVPKFVWNLVSFGFGLLIAFTGFDAFAGVLPNVEVSKFFTGLLLGAGGSVWHEKLDQWSRTAKGG